MKDSFLSEEIRIATLYKNELSGPEIAQKLNFSLKKIYSSLKKQNILRRKPTVQNEVRFRKKPLSYKLRSQLSMSEKELSIAALMLYFGEGAKTGTTVDFANSDPRALKVFLKFLREICGVNETKIRIYLYCFTDQNVTQLIKFWSHELNLKFTNFTKPYIRQSKPGQTRKMPWGVLHIRYHDKRLLEKILALCSDLLAKFVL